MLFHTERLRLVSENNNMNRSGYCILGFPFDSTETNIPGQRLGPSSIREKFLALESGDLTTKIFDAGDIVPSPGNAQASIKKITETLDDIFTQNQKIIPAVLGGEHTATLGAVESLKKKYPDIQVICLDAHYDLKDNFLGEKLTHSTVMRRIFDSGTEITIIGARAGSKDELKFSEKINTDISRISFKKPIYLSLDIDFFDPSVAPGVGDPETGGFFYENFNSLINKITDKGNIVALDIVEVNPLIENNITPNLAAKCLINILNQIKNNQK